VAGSSILDTLAEFGETFQELIAKYWLHALILVAVLVVYIIIRVFLYE